MISVGLPIFNNKNIAWLCFESLCNQKNVNFDWELLIMEERSGAFGEENIARYAERLRKVGCISIRYFSLDYHINLAAKWKRLAEYATFDTFIFCAADDYYEPNKLQMAYDKIQDGHDWVGYNNCLFYNIHSQKTMLFNAKSINWGAGNICACLTKELRKIPHTYMTSGIDYFVFNSIAPKNPFIDTSDAYKKGFASDGMNNISLTRKRHFDKPQKPFEATTLQIDCPDYVKQRLKGLMRGVKKDNKIVAVIPIKGRLPLLKHTIERLYKKNKIYKVICVGDEAERSVCELADAEFIVHDNFPLGKKWNAGFMAAKKHNPDGCLFVGSGDWVSDNWLEVINEYLGEYDLIGKPDFYMLDISDKMRACHWKGYTNDERRQEPIGIGRVLSKRILDAMEWQPMDSTLDNSLDYSMYHKTLELGGLTALLSDESLLSLSVSTNRWTNKHKFNEHYSGKLKSDIINDVDGFIDSNFPEAKQIFQ